MSDKIDYVKTTNYTKDALLKDKDKGLFGASIYTQLDVVIEKMNLCSEEEKKEPVVELLKDNLNTEKVNFISEIKSVISLVYTLVTKNKLTKSVYFEEKNPAIIIKSPVKIKKHIKKWVSIIESGEDNGLMLLESIIKDAGKKVDEFSDIFESETELKEETISEIKTSYENWLKQFNILKYLIKAKTTEFDLKYSDYVKLFKSKSSKPKKEEEKNSDIVNNSTN